MQPIQLITEHFAALSDPTRVRLLSLILHNREISVADLITITQLPQSKVSRHLAVLRHAGLASDRREGQGMHYIVAAPEASFTRAIFKLIKDSHLEIPELHRDLAQLAERDCCRLSRRELLQVST